jgi:hypothetical protein
MKKLQEFYITTSSPIYSKRLVFGEIIEINGIKIGIRKVPFDDFDNQLVNKPEWQATHLESGMCFPEGFTTKKELLKNVNMRMKSDEWDYAIAKVKKQLGIKFPVNEI